MTDPKFNRRDFLKTSAAGVLLASAATAVTGAQTAAPASPPAAPGSKWAYPPAEPGAIFRSDLTKCTPAARLTRSFEEGRWQMVDYETEEGVKGTMLYATPEHDCGELTLPLEAAGLCRIHLGINYTKTDYNIDSPYGLIQVKLDHEPAFRRVAMEDGVANERGDPKVGVNNFNNKSIQEAYWKTADVTGRALVFRQPDAPYNNEHHWPISNLAYVKLVPVAAAEAGAWRATQATADTRRGAMLFCTGQFTGHTSGTYTFRPPDLQWYRNEFAPYADSDIGILVFEAMRGNFCLFDTKLGYMGPYDRPWRDEPVEPLAAFTRVAHEHGVKLFASLRMIGLQYPMNRAPIARADDARAHPEWAKRDREGRPLTSLSLAYPGVRAHWIGLLREALERGIDGVQLHLNRSTPFVFYEEPTVQSFVAKHGVDPRQLPENDPRWQRHCAGIVTDYLREVKALVDEKPGRSLAVTLYAQPHKYDDDPSPFHPLRYACDVDTWIRDRIVDYLMPDPNTPLDFIRGWRALGGDRLHIWPGLMPRAQLPAGYAKLAKKYYDAGADGFSTWDGERRAARLSEWAAVQRLGHRDQLDRLAAEGPSWYRRVPLKVLEGYGVHDSFHDG
ncbi:MAG TPA: twin-arginine translocation signal domain-containing protein [Lacunisphaera sp.]|nr:twin-arginine translocation signal domain-containing protein [Lacunisphaera sp.]